MNIERDIRLADFTSYKIGGKADYFVAVESVDELVEAVSLARTKHMPYFLLGCGANVLISDNGFEGLVIHNRAGRIEADGLRVTAESGAVMSEVIEFCRQRGLSGLEHFSGIPSTVGGALWQNLHFLSPDRSRTVFIEEVLQQAVVLMPDGRVETVGVDFFKFGYDDSILHEQEIIVLQATFQLKAAEVEEIEQVIRSNLAWRADKHPSQPSCGSVFKKIEGIGAGRLIDEAGLKGKRIGGAEISTKHANFIINTGQATASDVYSLIQLIQKTVLDKTGYALETEIGLVGRFE